MVNAQNENLISFEIKYCLILVVTYFCYFVIVISAGVVNHILTVTMLFELKMLNIIYYVMDLIRDNFLPSVINSATFTTITNYVSGDVLILI